MESYNVLTTIKEEPTTLKEICNGMEIQTGDWNSKSTGVKEPTDLLGIGYGKRRDKGEFPERFSKG